MAVREDVGLKKMLLVFKWDTVEWVDKLETREWRIEVEVLGERRDN